MKSKTKTKKVATKNTDIKQEEEIKEEVVIEEEKEEKKNKKKEKKKEKKKNKKDKKKKKDRPKRESFIKSIFKEMKEVRFPTKKEMVKLSIATVLFIVFFGLLFYAVDMIMAWLKMVV